jgi:hypothetical protein
VVNYNLLTGIQKFEVYEENLNRLMKNREIFVDTKIRRINGINNHGGHRQIFVSD